MTPTTDTERALLAEILAHPDDDTPRLVYADYLDERDTVSVPCPKCVKGWTVIPYREDGDGDVSGGGFGYCPACHGTGSAPDTANADRAEFIRVQCELARTPETVYRNIYAPQTMHLPVWERIAIGQRHDPNPRHVELLARESALLDANREKWLRVDCPKCDAGGIRTMRDSAGELRATLRCQWCDGTGDIGGLVGLMSGADGSNWTNATVFRRGFPDAVQGCRLQDVMSQVACPVCSKSGVDVACGLGGCNGGVVWHPTPWLLRVLSHHPTVTRVPLVDRAPGQYGNTKGWFWSEWTPADNGTMRYPVPPVLIAAMPGAVSPGYDTADAATDALAVAVVAVGRNLLA